MTKLRRLSGEFDVLCSQSGGQGASQAVEPYSWGIWGQGEFYEGFPGGIMVKNLPANTGDAGDVGSISGSGRSPGVGNGNPSQYCCLENSMERGV